jgi:transposase InsO family protein
MLGNGHVRFGGRVGETHQPQGWPGAPTRPYTQQRTGDGWLYVAVVLDCFSRRVVGWLMAEHLRTELVLDALDMAIAQRQPAAGLIHHTDHGCQGGFNWSWQHLE